MDILVQNQSRNFVRTIMSKAPRLMDSGYVKKDLTDDLDDLSTKEPPWTEAEMKEYFEKYEKYLEQILANLDVTDLFKKY